MGTTSGSGLGRALFGGQVLLAEARLATVSRRLRTEHTQRGQGRRHQASATVEEERDERGRGKTGCPVPADHLWKPAKTELIKDEPLACKVPAGLQPLTPKVVVPAANPITKGKYELGRQLYFDPRISLDGTVSCATCHNPAKGWTDGMPVSIGIDGQTGGRSAPTRPQHRLRQDDVLGRPCSVAGRPGPRPDPEPDRDGRAVVQADRRPAAEDPGLQASSSRRYSAPT